MVIESLRCGGTLDGQLRETRPLAGSLEQRTGVAGRVDLHAEILSRFTSFFFSLLGVSRGDISLLFGPRAEAGNPCFQSHARDG
jgi:hypothetical protein